MEVSLKEMAQEMAKEREAARVWPRSGGYFPTLMRSRRAQPTHFRPNGAIASGHGDFLQGGDGEGEGGPLAAKAKRGVRRDRRCSLLVAQRRL